MKKIVPFIVFIILTLNASAQTYRIIGKGNSGETKCSGYIRQNEDSFTGEGSFTIRLSDMLERTYRIWEKEQIDERTIKYKVFDKELNHIIKQKCPNGKYVYFFEFPPLYPKQSRTIYKAAKEKVVFNGFVIDDGVDFNK